ncbi:MAG: phosphatidylserine decarboxylase [Pyrinomonadaceae bacterium]|nr:phosphatidylserine decarboxylase [Pyrinomonadaceae bacterium]
MVKEGIPFVVGCLLLAAICLLLFLTFGSFVFIGGIVLFVLLAVFMAYFFRDPQRTVPNEADAVISAADGRVTRVEDRENGKFVSVFLSPLDVHINRAPISGKIVKVDYIKGKKNPATSDEASLINERNALTIEGEKMTVIVTQIAGIVARRIVCWSKLGDKLAVGDKFGLIKFSSRTDLLIPKNVEVLVKVGDRVVGGETVIARLKS